MRWRRRFGWSVEVVYDARGSKGRMGSKWKWESEHRPISRCLSLGLFSAWKTGHLLCITDLRPHHQYTTISTPRHGKRFTSYLEFRNEVFRPGIPEPNRPIRRTTSQLEFPNRVEQDLFYCVTMASQLGLTTRGCPFWVPYSHRLVICACGDQSARGIP